MPGPLLDAPVAPSRNAPAIEALTFYLPKDTPPLLWAGRVRMGPRFWLRAVVDLFLSLLFGAAGAGMLFTLWWAYQENLNWGLFLIALIPALFLLVPILTVLLLVRNSQVLCGFNETRFFCRHPKEGLAIYVLKDLKQLELKKHWDGSITFRYRKRDRKTTNAYYWYNMASIIRGDQEVEHLFRQLY